MPAGCTLVLTPPGRPAGAAAALVNIANVGSASAGYITAYACGSPRPTVAIAQVVPGLTRATSGEVGLGVGGNICIFSSVTTHLVVDLLGWLAAGGQRVTTVAPHIVLDTGAGARLVAGSITPVVVAPGATAASIDVALWSTSNGGFLSVFPCGVARPSASTVNAPVNGQVSTNHIMVGLDAAGRACVFASAAAHAAIEVDAIYRSAGSTMMVAAPVRRIDTRTGVGTSGALAAGELRAVVVAAPSTVLTIQATMVSPAAAGELKVFACDSEDALGVRTPAGGINAAGMAVVRTNGAGQVCLRSSVATHVVVDLFSWTT